MKIQLFKKNGEMVATVEVVADNVPDIITVGGKSYVLSVGRYVEGELIVEGKPVE